MKHVEISIVDREKAVAGLGEEAVAAIEARQEGPESPSALLEFARRVQLLVVQNEQLAVKYPRLYARIPQNPFHRAVRELALERGLLS